MKVIDPGPDPTMKTVYRQTNEAHEIAPGVVTVSNPLNIFPQEKGPEDVVYLVEEDDENSLVLAFSNAKIRRGFIRKVYAILLVQLSVTIGFMAQCMYHEQTRLFVRHNIYCCYTALGIMLAISLALIFCSDLRRKSPTNIIMLGVYTLAVSYVLGTVASLINQNEVLLAVGITATIVIALTIFAFQTKYDFTIMGGMLITFLIVVFTFGILCYFWQAHILRLIFSGMAVILLSFFIVYDTQLMIGGKHKYSISPEEYVLAALSLYIDIINLFIHILRLSR